MEKPTTALIRVFLSVSLFYFFIAPVVCSANLRFCATIHFSRVECMRVTYYDLDWGKWIVSYYNTREIWPRFGTDNPLTVCSSGREMTATGTTGSIKVTPCGYSDEFYSFKVRWSRAWAGTGYLEELFNENYLAVQKTKIDDWQQKYEVTFKPHYACVKLTRWDLNIPDDNPKIKGEKQEAGDSWYTYINWLEQPAGGLTLSYRTQEDSSGWVDTSSGTVSVYEKGNIEKYYWAQITREALGLNDRCDDILGKKRVNRNLFSGDKCIGINFDRRWDTGYKYRIFLVVTDDDGKVFLTGQIVKEKS